MDPLGILPPHIRRNAEVEQMADSQIAQAQALATALHQRDPNLKLTFFGERAKPIHGIKPGRWHVVRTNPGTADSYMPIETPNGSYREPDFGVLAELDGRDLWKKGALEKIKAGPSSEELRDELRDEQRRDEMKADYRAARRVPGDGGFSRRKWGKGIVGS